MNRIVASLLIIFIFSMHSAWAIGVHADSNHVVSLVKHIEADHHSSATDIDTQKNCDDDHGCHISAHVAGLVSTSTFVLHKTQSSIDTNVKLSKYSYSQTIPQRPPKV